MLEWAELEGALKIITYPPCHPRLGHLSPDCWVCYPTSPEHFQGWGHLPPHLDSPPLLLTGAYAITLPGVWFVPLAWNNWVECAGLAKISTGETSLYHHITSLMGVHSQAASADAGCGFSAFPAIHGPWPYWPAQIFTAPASGHFLFHSFINSTNYLHFEYPFMANLFYILQRSVFQIPLFEKPGVTSWLSQLWPKTFPTLAKNPLHSFYFFSPLSPFRLFMGRDTKSVYSNQQSFNKTTVSYFLNINFQFPWF